MGFRALNTSTYSSVDALVTACKASGSLPFAKKECEEFQAFTNLTLSSADKKFLSAIKTASLPYQITEAAEQWDGSAGLATTGI